MIGRLLKPFKKHTRREVDPTMERIEELREYRQNLRRQDQKASRQIDELMLQRLRNHGVGA